MHIQLWERLAAGYRNPHRLLGPACGLALLLVCFRAPLFEGQQFAYRDAGHFYYPLYLRVQQEWEAGRWPLWDPGQNAGIPLLGMPMAAVLYPGKILYTALSYPLAARLYPVAHVAFAWMGMFAFARTCGQSATGAGLAAMAYAFGAPVLFQYCNIIYLVGAAWMPWGLLALEQMLHRGRRWGLHALALVVAMQVLGGDPESAYLLGLCGTGYALVLAVDKRVQRRWVWCGAAVVGWVAVTLGAAYATPWITTPRWLPLPAWSLLGTWLVWRWRRRGRTEPLVPTLGALAAAGVLAFALAAAQVLPILEYSTYTVRAHDDRTDRVFGFCVEPYRAIEAVWPNAFGTSWPENRAWIQAIPPAGERLLWTPSLYLGGLTLILATSGFLARGAPPWRRWLALIAVAACAASAGKFASPLWLARWIPGVTGILGPHDPLAGVDRADAFLPDGAGSPYALLAATLPGFALFRYPGKLTTLAAAAFAALAGAGWDRLAAGEARTARRAAAAGLAVTLMVLILVLSARGPMIDWVARHLPDDIEFGPFDPSAALESTVRALVHGGAVFSAALALALTTATRRRLAEALALLVMALDLGTANAKLVWTVPQAEFDAPSRAAQRIAAAERERPEPGPFRIHRVEMRYPVRLTRSKPPQLLRAVIAWKRDTLEPLFGVALGLQQTLVEGVLEADDYSRFFGARLVAPSQAGDGTGGRPIYAFPRAGFDLWNSRYVLMSVAANGWLGESSGYERIAPPASVVLDGVEARRWIEKENWQLLRNHGAFPRAWLVHLARVRPPIRGRNDPQYHELIQDLVYLADAFSREPGRPVYDLRAIAFVETDHPENLAGYISRTLPTPVESVVVSRYEPQRVELTADLERPGLIVLADTFYPGWHLRIDGVAAPIYRTNRLMRGAAVRAGHHTLVYTYDPASFRIGAVLSICGLIALAALVPWALAARHSSV